MLIWRRLKDMAVAGLVALALIAVVRSLPSDLPEAVNGPAFVIDGDSLEILGVRVRLYGVDAPERTQMCDRGGAYWTCGQAAAAALRDRIAGRAVQCRTHGYDKYGRILATCQVAGEELNAWLVRAGWAVAFGANMRLEAEARSAARGIWAGRFERPADWRKRHGI